MCSLVHTQHGGKQAPPLLNYFCAFALYSLQSPKSNTRSAPLKHCDTSSSILADCSVTTEIINSSNDSFMHEGADSALQYSSDQQLDWFSLC